MKNIHPLLTQVSFQVVVKLAEIKDVPSVTTQWLISLAHLIFRDEIENLLETHVIWYII